MIKNEFMLMETIFNAIKVENQFVTLQKRRQRTQNHRLNLEVRITQTQKTKVDEITPICL